MKRAFLAVGLVLLASCAFAEIVDIGVVGVGARTLAMGKTGVAGLDDASAIFINPAGLTLNPNTNFLSMAGTLLTDVNYQVLGMTQSSPFGRWGIGYINASVGDIPIITGSGSTATVVGVSAYSSKIMMLSYASKLGRFLQGKADNVSVGLNWKYYSQGFSGGGAALSQAEGCGLDADLGIMWKVNPWANLGLMATNFIPFSYGGKFIWLRNNQQESLGMVTRLGGNFKVLEQGLSLLFDYELSRPEAGQPGLWHAGLEYWPQQMLALRLGINQRPRGGEDGVGIDNNLTAGVGLKHAGFTFDYAYHQFGELTENATHFFSIGYRGAEELIKKYEKGKLFEGVGIPLPEVVAKPALKTFIDFTEEYWASKPIEYLATLGIMDGYPDQTFKPEKGITRGELAVILVRAKGFAVEKVDQPVFQDVAATNWMAPYIKVAVERKYIQGYPDQTFQPEQGISRAEAAVVFSKSAGLFVRPMILQRPFADLKVSHWAAPAVAAAKNAGFFEYLADKDFEAEASLTRAETAEILSKSPFVKEKIKKLISGEKQ